MNENTKELGHRTDVHLLVDRCECTDSSGTRCTRPMCIMVDDTEMCFEHYQEWKKKGKK